jgi:hypothetical protein
MLQRDKNAQPLANRRSSLILTEATSMKKAQGCDPWAWKVERGISKREV